MDEAWERAVEAALRGGGGAAPSAPPEGSSATSSASSSSPPRSLTLDGVIKCLHGRLPSPEILERYQSLEHLSIANIGVSSLERFPRLRSLTRLILSDNRISTGLEHLVEVGLDSLRDLDLSNNRIGSVEDLAPLARLRLVSLDLYECPVTRVKDYRSQVFGLIRSLKYLDKMDADENERPESDEEEDEEEEGEEEEEEEEDPGNGEVDGDDMDNGLDVHMANGNGALDGGVILNGDEDESEAEEEMDNGLAPEVANGFRVVPARPEVVDEDESDYEVDLGEEIDEEEDEEEEDVVEVLDVSDDDEEDDVDEEDDDDDGEEMDDGDERGEIDGHERGEEEEDDNGELGEEENGEGLMAHQGFEEVEDQGAYDVENVEDDDEDKDTGAEYLVQISRQADEMVERDFDANEIEDEHEIEEEDGLDQIDTCPETSRPEPSTSQINKRKRDDDHDDDGDDGDDTVGVDDLRSVRFRQ